MDIRDPELDVAVAVMVAAKARFVVEQRAMRADYGGVEFLVAGLDSIVGFKRLADRPRDRNDLIGLAEIHGDLPIEPIPGLDTDA